MCDPNALGSPSGINGDTFIQSISRQFVTKVKVKVRAVGTCRVYNTRCICLFSLAKYCLFLVKRFSVDKEKLAKYSTTQV